MISCWAFELTCLNNKITTIMTRWKLNALNLSKVYWKMRLVFYQNKFRSEAY